FAEDMTDVLTQETLDTFSEFLDPINISLRHVPRSGLSVWRPRTKFANTLFDAEVPGNVRHQVFKRGERFHGLQRDRLLKRQRVEARHTHQLRVPVDFRR